jgi:hypothetical protein
MKTLKLLALAIILFASSTIHAQVSVSVNIGTAPSWGPQGYSDVDYYYLPDVEAYYDIRATQFIYFNGGRWTRSRYLPGQYRNYDLYNGYKVVLNDYHGSRPYSNYRNDRVRYYKGYHGKPQRSIGAYHQNDGRDYENRGDHGNRGYSRGNEGHGKNGHGNEGRGNEGRDNNGNGRGHGRG